MKNGLQAVPDAELLRALLDSRVPKTEREHAAAREIEKLRALLMDCERAIIVGDLRGNVGRRIRAALGENE